MLLKRFNENYLNYKYSPVSRSFNIDVIDIFDIPNFKKYHLNRTGYNKEYIDYLNKYLKDNMYKAFIMYHGTSSDIDIDNEGLKKTSLKTKKSYQSQVGYVYLSIYKDSAKTFGKLSYPSSSISVYYIKAQIALLKPDLDQLYNLRKEGFECGDTLADSLLYGHGARIKGNIPPYMIIDKQNYS